MDVVDLEDHFNIPYDLIKKNNPQTQFKKGEYVFIPDTPSKKIMEKTIVNNSEVEATKAVNDDLKIKGKLFWPVPVNTKKRFYYQTQGHGINIPGRKGTSIISMTDGVVLYSKKIRPFEYMIVVETKFNVKLIYSQNQKSFVSKGDKVVQGQVIALMGKSGDKYIPHLHLEAFYGDNQLDLGEALKGPVSF